tara:strand:+ start:15686 stop:15982 length:297 start_codon:yes stop_codon:yes gene_type:complete
MNDDDIYGLRTSTELSYGDRITAGVVMIAVAGFALAVNNSAEKAKVRDQSQALYYCNNLIDQSPTTEISDYLLENVKINHGSLRGQTCGQIIDQYSKQ